MAFILSLCYLVHLGPSCSISFSAILSPPSQCLIVLYPQQVLWSTCGKELSGISLEHPLFISRAPLVVQKEGSYIVYYASLCANIAYCLGTTLIIFKNLCLNVVT